MTLEINQMLVLSTAHLTEHACNVYLSDERAGVYAKGEYGWFVYAPSLLDEDEIPMSLLDCIEFATAKGIDFIMFDCDGPNVSGLDTYDW